MAISNDDYVTVKRWKWVTSMGYAYEARLVDGQTVKVDEACIEARSLILDVRVSNFEIRASIRDSTTINIKFQKFRGNNEWYCWYNQSGW